MWFDDKIMEEAGYNESLSYSDILLLICSGLLQDKVCLDLGQLRGGSSVFGVRQTPHAVTVILDLCIRGLALFLVALRSLATAVAAPEKMNTD